MYMMHIHTYIHTYISLLHITSSSSSLWSLGDRQQRPIDIDMSKAPLRTCVIGGGIVGLAVARSLLWKPHSLRREVLLFERNAMCGAETSSRSSEVIHSSLYYPPESRKAQLCLRGRKLLYEYCQGTSSQRLRRYIIQDSVHE